MNGGEEKACALRKWLPRPLFDAAREVFPDGIRGQGVREIQLFGISEQLALTGRLGLSVDVI